VQINRVTRGLPSQRPSRHKQPTLNNERRSRDRSSVLLLGSNPIPESRPTEMATTVGATLSSTKMAVTQGDLHLVGSSVDQMIVQFDQAAYEEYLSSLDQTQATRSRHPRAHAAAPRSAPAAPSPLEIPALQRKRPLPSVEYILTHASARSPIYHPAREMEIPGGYLFPRRRNRNAECRARR
jgi:hypothetical protein